MSLLCIFSRDHRLRRIPGDGCGLLQTTRSTMDTYCEHRGLRATGLLWGTAGMISEAGMCSHDGQPGDPES